MDIILTCHFIFSEVGTVYYSLKGLLVEKCLNYFSC